ncbi:MAG: 50S ribosomal protein L6 [Halothiobacillaceae bacterium]
MSRVAKKPVALPKGVEVKVDGQMLSFKGPKGTMEQQVHETVSVEQVDGALQFHPANEESIAMAGTMRALAQNIVTGLTTGFERRLQLVGVGYRAQAQGNKLNLTLGYSHPIDYPIPEGITAETPSQTEIVIKGANKQLVGQVASEIRGFRPPEPYKGKGVKYADETILRKEAKKK